MPPAKVVLFQDETKLRLYPVLRRAWSLPGQQGCVAISGKNAQMVLACALNIRTGYRITLQHPRMSAASFQQFLRKVRKSYPGRPIAMLLDNGGLHTAGASQRLAKKLGITLIWLPKQASELNCVDQLWRSVKADISANKQYDSIQEHAQTAESYVQQLTKNEALRKAGVQSEKFWLQKFI
jgi:transposase